MMMITLYALITIATIAGFHVIATWLQALRRGIDARRQSSAPMQPLEKWPFVSVIIPAWCERGTVERCIESLAYVDYPSWEIIVVAGGPDDTYEVALLACRNLKQCTVIRQQPRGKNAALNQGMRTARGEVIVLLDADSQVSPNWLRELVAPIDGEVLATTGRPSPLRPTGIALTEQMERIDATSIRGATTLQGSGSIAVHRSALQRIGDFPEHVLVGVDWDLDVRVAQAGIRRAVSPQAVVVTERPATLGEYWHNEVRWRRAHFASLLRHHKTFLAGPLAAGLSLYLYALAWFVLASMIATTLVVLLARGELQGFVSGLWIVFIAWLLLRRAALAAEVAAYTRDWRWLGLLWAPPLLLLLTFGAIVVATLTLHRHGAHFKGPRMYNYGSRAN